MDKSWKVVAAFIVVFLAGGAIGSVFTLRLTAPPPPPKVDPTSMVQAKPEEFGAQLMKRWLLSSNQLALTQQQREKIRPILFDTAEDLQRTREEGVHSVTLLIEHMQDEIAALLSPAQRDKFYQLIQNQRERMNRYVREQERRSLKQAQDSAATAKPQ